MAKKAPPRVDIDDSDAPQKKTRRPLEQRIAAQEAKLAEMKATAALRDKVKTPEGKAAAKLAKAIRVLKEHYVGLDDDDHALVVAGLQTAMETLLAN
jgi:hypothetical protein